jgi:hypothetical protein
MRQNKSLVLLWVFPLCVVSLWMFTGQTRTLLLRWFFFAGFMFVVWVSGWAIITITRLRNEQAVAVTMLKVLMARGIRDAVEHMEQDKSST